MAVAAIHRGDVQIVDERCSVIELECWWWQSGGRDSSGGPGWLDQLCEGETSI